MFKLDVPEIVTRLFHEIPFPRAQAQRSLFTLGMPLGVDHEAVLKREAGDDCERTTIAGSSKRDILDLLERMGIDAVSLQYPGADREGTRMDCELRRKY